MKSNSLRQLAGRLRLPLLGLLAGALAGGLLGFLLPAAPACRATATMSVLPVDPAAETKLTDLLPVVRELTESQQSYEAVRQKTADVPDLPALRRRLTLSLTGNLVTVTATGKTEAAARSLAELGQQVLSGRLSALLPAVILTPQPVTAAPLASLTGDTPLRRSLRFGLLGGGAGLLLPLCLSLLLEVTDLTLRRPDRLPSFLPPVVGRLSESESGVTALTLARLCREKSCRLLAVTSTLPSPDLLPPLRLLCRRAEALGLSPTLVDGRSFSPATLQEAAALCPADTVPTLLLLPDAASPAADLLTALADATLLIERLGGSRLDRLETAAKRLTRLGAPPLGLLLETEVCHETL